MERSLVRMDLNLLKALHILLEERNVARAADRLFITPSAMSKTLHRLREALNDPLLVRVTGGLVPTPRAEQLAAVLRTTFENLEVCLAPEVFDPALASGRVRIAAPETFAIGAIPQLVAAMRAAAPNLIIESLHLGDDYLDRLADGTLDFVVYLDQEYPESYLATSLFSAGPKVWCRRDHPLTRVAAPALADICRYPKVMFHTPSVRLTEVQNILKALEQGEVGREVMLETSHLLVALVMLRHSDALMVAPDYLFVDSMFDREVTSLPLDQVAMFSKLRLDMCLVQHERTERSPLHRWFVAQAVEAFTRAPADALPSTCASPTVRRIRAW